MTAVNNNASPMDGAPVIDFDKFKPTRSFTAARKRKDLAMRVLIDSAVLGAAHHHRQRCQEAEPQLPEL